MSKYYAVISIGTNSTRVLLADMAPERPHTALARSIGTRVGEGLKDGGMLGEEPMRRTLDAVRSHFRAVRGHYVKLFAISTSAVRLAENGEKFAQDVRDIIGAPVHILSGDEEAEASYRGAITALGRLHGEEVGVVDTGGGSTEYAIGSGMHSDRAVSCEIGAVRLTEAIPALAGREGIVDIETIERARVIARDALTPLASFRACEKLVLVGGSATTAAAIVRGKKSAATEYELTRSDLQRTLVRLCGLDYEARKDVVGMRPQRADILPAGIIVLETVLDIVARDRAIATTSDLLLGYLLAQRDAAPAPARTYPRFANGRTPGAAPRT